MEVKSVASSIMNAELASIDLYVIDVIWMVHDEYDLNTIQNHLIKENWEKYDVQTETQSRFEEKGRDRERENTSKLRYIRYLHTHVCTDISGK